MAARPQWYFWSIGPTNRVQPYCRLAIITMQMMPKISCPQRVASDAAARVSIVVAVVVDISPALPLWPSFVLLSCVLLSCAPRRAIPRWYVGGQDRLKVFLQLDPTDARQLPPL